METKLVYLAENDFEANTVKGFLDENNIDAYVIGGGLQVCVGEVPVDAGYSKVYVKADDFNSVKEYIEEYKVKLKEEESKIWNCESCKEASPMSFTVCWNCGTNK